MSLLYKKKIVVVQFQLFCCAIIFFARFEINKTPSPSDGEYGENNDLQQPHKIGFFSW